MPCYFCQRNIQVIDFKDIALLRRFISGMAKIRAKKKTGVCSKHQRKMAIAIKRARFLGLLPYVVN
ncbi:30S ribosomal protein S18 [Patescibacteria group bacterium]|nr:30S ribosomal protein S18 [Patescibacteria group bacterium]MBU4480920.1 30S ribosomal protein S18 [Patescibacteria group bacterium]